jgi:hypothetical protein
MNKHTEELISIYEDIKALEQDLIDMKNTIPKTSILSLKEGRLHNLKLALSD